MLTQSRRMSLLMVAVVIVLAAGSISVIRTMAPSGGNGVFEGSRAYRDVLYQMELGPRTPGSQAHQVAIDWMMLQLNGAGWHTELQELQFSGKPVQNVIAQRGSGHPWIVLGAHYDSRIAADRDPDPAKRSLPVPGANDGASGVAVLLELARSLPENLPGQMTLVFFDAEDSGELDGWDWIMGSSAFVSHLEAKPDAAVVVDMIGDADLNIYLESNSDPTLSRQIWDQAAALGYSNYFIASRKYSMIDDHTPFLNAGIPAVDIIDFDYPYWHTTQDTANKVSAQSLEVVGRTLLAWLQNQP